MAYKKYIISYTYIGRYNLHEALTPPDMHYHRTDSITKDELKCLVEGIKMGLGERLVGDVMFSEIQ